jgi:hypothetical protein
MSKTANSKKGLKKPEESNASLDVAPAEEEKAGAA